jgi:hypothetical protein
LLKEELYPFNKNGMKNEGVQIAAVVTEVERENVLRKIIYQLWLGE